MTEAPAEPRPLNFRLPAFMRLAWASLEARDHWAPRLVTAIESFRSRLEDLAVAGELEVVLLSLPPASVPLLMRRMLLCGRVARILGEARICDLRWAGVAILPSPRHIVCLAGDVSSVAGAELAWERGDLMRLRRLLGAPDCCAQSTSEAGPQWRLDWDVARGGARDWQTNYALHRLGLAPAPWLPCREDCAATLRRVEHLPPPADVKEFLGWPMEWSTLHGIIQVITPAFRLVHDGFATAEKHVAYSNVETAPPAHTPVGLSFPFRRTQRLPLEERRSTKNGLAHAKELPAELHLGTLATVDSARFDADSEEPVLVPGWAKRWPALKRWTPQYLASTLLDAPAAVTDGLGEEHIVAFSEFLSDLLSGGTFSTSYLKDFPFEHFAPRLTTDLILPDSLRSWHEDLEPAERPTLRSFYLGGAGTGSPLHFDILWTSAWNVVIWGSKEWVLCPPSSDARSFSSDTNLFDDEQRRSLSRRGLDMRFTRQGAGDLLFVPPGWWHQVRNLEPTLAVTANLVNDSNAELVAAAAHAALDPVLERVGYQLLRAIRLRHGGRDESFASAQETPLAGVRTSA